MCSGSGTWGDPYIISNITIDGNNQSNCIRIENTIEYFEIRNCTLINSGVGKDGIKFINITNFLLIENNISYLNGRGINLSNCKNSSISQNKINHNSGDGICVLNSHNIKILDNIVVNNTNKYGIYLKECYDNTILLNLIGLNRHGMEIVDNRNNTISENWLLFNERGINFESTENNTITHNTFYSNGEALFLESSNNNTISLNTIEQNNLGIDLRNSNYTSITFNSFIRNNDTFTELNCIGNSFLDNIFLTGVDDDNENNDDTTDEGDFIDILVSFIILGSIILILGLSIYHTKSNASTNRNRKSEEILEDINNKSLLLQIFNENRPPGQYQLLENLDLTLISNRCLNYIDKMGLDEDTKKEILLDVISIPPNERKQMLKDLNMYIKEVGNN